MPFAVAGQCYGSSVEALEAFQKGFPYFGDTNWVWHVSSSISATGLITYSVNTKPMTTNTVSTRTGTLQLASCTTVDISPFDPVVGSSVFALFFVGVVGTWLLAQNLGLILEAVKKW